MKGLRNIFSSQGQDYARVCLYKWNIHQHLIPTPIIIATQAQVSKASSLPSPSPQAEVLWSQIGLTSREGKVSLVLSEQTPAFMAKSCGPLSADHVGSFKVFSM